MNTQGALIFLIRTLLDLATYLFLIRFLLQLAKADFYNPISQTVVRLTNPLLEPLRKIVPSKNQVDTASIIMILALIVAKAFLLIKLQGLTSVAPAAILLFTIHSLAQLLLGFFFWAVLISVILSWVLPDPYHPFTQIVRSLTEPVMAPARRILPPMGGLDLSPIIVLFAIQFLMVLFQV